MNIDNALERKLLVVPFNDNYYVDEVIKQLLTEEEFFRHCFLKPNFKKEIEEIKALTSNEVQAFDIDLSVSELIQKYNSFNDDLSNLYNWIETNQNELYCIKGDAGTGKSTFLHYLKYKYYNSDLEWDIIDIQEAIKKVSLLGHSVEFSDFQSLYSKAVSSILVYLKNKLFKYKADSLDFASTKNILSKLSKGYNNYFSNLFPDEKVVSFFNRVADIDKLESSDKEISNAFAILIKTYIDNLFSVYKGNYPDLFAVILEWFLCIVVSLGYNKRHIIAFDNFERFIGTDEIYSFQLTHFVSELRNIQNQISDNLPVLANNFQIIIFMRNTSTRMFVPQQVAEITAHSLDLSEWFHSSKIIEKKIQWYNDKNIKIDGAEIIKEILHDIGGGNNCVRGLRTKLNMIFNYNKRVIIKFVIKVISDSENEEYLNKYLNFWENDRKNNYNLDKNHSRFVARMIIFRLILNKLRNDEFFKNIIVQKSDEKLYSLGYARKILTILYDFKIQNENPYMNFADIIRNLFGRNDCINTYFDSNNKSTRNTISKILFYMNYYNLRLNNWLQFIDIQYNMPPQNIVVSSFQQLDNLIINDYNNINIRITNAGIAYLYFIVSSFEYFSCKCLYSSEKKKIAGDIDLPPITAIIPDAKEIMAKKTEDLLCLRTIKAVFSEANSCLRKLCNNYNNIDFRYDDRSIYISHTKRIINAHTGFLGNYKHCIKEMNKQEYNSNVKFAIKLNKLLTEIDVIINYYKSYM